MWVFEHHQAAITAVTEEMSAREDVLGVLICGSVAHGFALENSDVDVKIVCTDALYGALAQAGNTDYFDRTATHYEGGYIDGEFISVDSIRQTAQNGSEPMRFDYQDAIVTLDRRGDLAGLAAQAACYPVEHKRENLTNFYGQFCAWKWYYYEALRRDNRYLAHLSALRFALFAGRLILAYNELLFPWHKWFLRVLADAPKQPAGLMRCMNTLIEQKRAEDVERLYNMVSDFTYWPRDKRSTRQILREVGRKGLDELPFAADL